MNQPATPVTPPPAKPPPKCVRVTIYHIGNVKLEEQVPVNPVSAVSFLPSAPARYVAMIDTLVDVGQPQPYPIKDLRIQLPLATDLTKAYEIICDQELFMSLAQKATDEHMDRVIKRHHHRQAQKPLIQIAGELPPGPHGG